MRDIRARIAQRHGIELSSQQIQELAARRLEAILDPRHASPSLIEQMRRDAAAVPEISLPTPEAGYSFDDTTIYESHRGVLRLIRRLLNPLLKLFFNPNPMIHALHTQARLNREAAAREAGRMRLQAEWNALHYEILQRLVTDVSRVSIEMQSLALRVESLSARVDFNDRRVRAVEASAPPGRAPRAVEQPAAAPAPAAPEAAAAETAPSEGVAAEGNRRRRRRRRGRRGGATQGDAAGAASPVTAGDQVSGAEPEAGDEVDEGGAGEQSEQIVAPAQPSPPATFEPGREAAAPAMAPAEPTPPVATAQPAPPAPAAAPPEQPSPPRDEPAPEAALEPPDPGPPER